MNSHNFHQGRLALVVTTLLGLAALAAAPAAHANITTSGGVSFTTGSPMPTLSITAPITLDITTTGSFSLLAFDNWVLADAALTIGSASTGQALSYQLNGVAGTSTLAGLIDNRTSLIGSLTRNDGFIYFNVIPVTAGQTLTINPQTFTFASSTSFNPKVPTAFNGNVFGTDQFGNLLTNTVSVFSAVPTVPAVPEPSSWALMAAGALGLGVYSRRRAKRG